jgi:anti-sigma B factor antagonist
VILQFNKKQIEPGMTVLEIKGSIHCGPECARMEKQIDELIAARENRVIFDMTAVTHMDSAAIGSLVRCLVKLKKSGGGLRMVGAQSMIEYSLKLTKVDKLIPAFKTVPEAATGFAISEAPQA